MKDGLSQPGFFFVITPVRLFWPRRIDLLKRNDWPMAVWTENFFHTREGEYQFVKLVFYPAKTAFVRIPLPCAIDR